MKSKSSLPVITKTGGLDPDLQPIYRSMLELDFLATDIHSLLQAGSYKGGLDYLRSPVTAL
jgi:hypothetical protein